MRTFLKVILCLTLSFAFVFTCMGYAAYSTTLSIEGETVATPLVDVFITGLELDSANSSGYTSEVSDYHHPRALETTLNFNNRTGKVTYKVTLYNNTPYRYAYSSLVYTNTEGYNNNLLNNGITLSAKDSNRGTLNASDVIEAYSEMVIYITYQNTSRNNTNKDIVNLINIKFGVNVDSVETVAKDRAFETFQNVLNDTSEGGSYSVLIDKIDDKYTGKAGEEWTSNYIGNVVDASNADSQAIQQLFGENLKITIDNTETNVTVIIKRENIDNNEKTGDNFTATANGRSYTSKGNEMTMYMTTSTLKKNSTPVIYVAAFSCVQNDDGTLGEWYMLGDTYEGTSRVVGYEGQATEGSFVTDDWYATKNQTFKVTDDYSYTITKNQKIKDITQVAADNNLKNIFKNLVTRADQILRDGSQAGTAIEQLAEAYDQATRCFTKDANGNITVNNGVLRSQLIPLVRGLDAALSAFD